MDAKIMTVDFCLDRMRPASTLEGRSTGCEPIAGYAADTTLHPHCGADSLMAATKPRMTWPAADQAASRCPSRRRLGSTTRR